MHLHHLLVATTALLCGTEALRSGNKVKLSNVQSLTLRKDLKTSHRRVPAIPQLQCVGGSAKGLYEVDIMRCKNQGFDYNEEDIQWSCTASLPEEFKLGATDVICEGYDSPDDPYILKGSCGVEYKLILTRKGEEKYGRRKGGDGYPQSKGDKLAGILFWCVFAGVAVWILFNIVKGWLQNGGQAVGGGNRPGWGGGGGGGGGGWGGPDDPPPPYDWRPSQNKPGYGSQSQSWRPGFWSGALGGAAAGYAAGRAGNSSNTWGRGGGWDNGEGSSRSSSGSSSYSSTRHESTGFGSTSRR